MVCLQQWSIRDACIVDILYKANYLHMHKANNLIKTMSCQPNPIYECPCLVLAEFMAMEGYELVTKSEFLDWTLEMPKSMPCYQTLMMLQASGIGVQKLDNKG